MPDQIAALTGWEDGDDHATAARHPRVLTHKPSGFFERRRVKRDGPERHPAVGNRHPEPLGHFHLRIPTKLTTDSEDVFHPPERSDAGVLVSSLSWTTSVNKQSESWHQHRLLFFERRGS